MLDICLLGTAGMMPLPNRALTSLVTRFNGSMIMIDCGEGTQVSLKKKGISSKPIDFILFTHFHADHISGLPGLLLTMGNAERVEPVTMVGPKGLQKTVEALRVIAPELPFEIKYIELSENYEELKLGEYRIEAFKVHHNVTCYGYTINIDRSGRFDAERAKAADIPLKFWNRLQKGETIEEDGKTYTSDMVLGPTRRGLKVTYCTDTRPCKAIETYAKDADLAILEGMYAEPEKLEKAKQYKHMTFYEAANIAKNACVKEMWLTHYSPSLIHAEQYMDKVKEIFPNTILSKDGREVTLYYDEE